MQWNGGMGDMREMSEWRDGWGSEADGRRRRAVDNPTGSGDAATKMRTDPGAACVVGVGSHYHWSATVLASGRTDNGPDKSIIFGHGFCVRLLFVMRCLRGGCSVYFAGTAGQRALSVVVDTHTQRQEGALTVWGTCF